MHTVDEQELHSKEQDETLENDGIFSGNDEK